MDFKEKIEGLRKYPQTVNEVMDNYNMGLITNNVAMHQLGALCKEYENQKEKVKEEFDLSEMALTLVMLHM